jgi:chromosome segregation ATPase
MEPKLGAPQTCPVCGGSNPSGLSLPKQCVWCKKKITMSRENIDVVINDLEANIAWLKKEAELHELAMQQNKDRMQDLEEENAALRQRNAELVEALEDGLKQMDYQCQATASAYEGCEDCETWCEVYNWKKKARAALERMKEG